MLHHSKFNYTGDGVLHAGSTIGIISHTPFSDEELPDPFYLYTLKHPNKRNRKLWVLERLEYNDTTAIRSNSFYDDTPNAAYVCFVDPPEVDYMMFEEDDYEMYINWGEDFTMADLIAMAAE